MEQNRYYWLKFPKDFFTSKRIKKLRSLAGGDTFTIIYLKMQLKALATDGILVYTGIEPSFAEEIALDIDEGSENVGVTINYLLACGLMERIDENHLLLPYVRENTGSETASAQRGREYRASLTDEQKDAERERIRLAVRKHRAKEIECNGCNERVTNVEKELEKEKELDIHKRFTPPSVEEVYAYCSERRNGIDAQAFVDFYESKGWMVGKNRMKDWKASVRTWEQNRKKDNGTKGASRGTDYNAMVLEEFLNEDKS